MLDLESPLRWPHYFNETWLRNHSVTAVVRTGITPAGSMTSGRRAPSGHIGTIPSWHITYSNADRNHYLRPPLPAQHKVRGIASFITNCNSNTKTRRLELLSALEAGGVPVYSFGRCHNTHSVAKLFPDCVANQTDTFKGERSPHFDFIKMCVLRRFMFAAAFENDVVDENVSEKLYQPFLAGTVPVYAGAPNVHSYLPAPEAAVVVTDFNDGGVARAVGQVKALMNNPALSARAFAWKTSMAPKWQMARLDAFIERSYATLPCLLCDHIAYYSTNFPRPPSTSSPSPAWAISRP